MITHRYGNMQTPPASSEGKSLAGRWQSWARKEQGTENTRCFRGVQRRRP